MIETEGRLFIDVPISYMHRRQLLVIHLTTAPLHTICKHITDNINSSKYVTDHMVQISHVQKIRNTNADILNALVINASNI